MFTQNVREGVRTLGGISKIFSIFFFFSLFFHMCLAYLCRNNPHINLRFETALFLEVCSPVQFRGVIRI